MGVVMGVLCANISTKICWLVCVCEREGDIQYTTIEDMTDGGSVAL